MTHEEFPLQPGFKLGETVLTHNGQLGIVTEVDEAGRIWGYRLVTREGAETAET